VSSDWTIATTVHALPVPELRQQALREIHLTPVGHLQAAVDQWRAIAGEWTPASVPRIKEGARFSSGDAVGRGNESPHRLTSVPFPPPEHPSLGRFPRESRRFVVDGQVVYSAYARHPGSGPNNFLARALRLGR